jgi:hypothetical protein
VYRSGKRSVRIWAGMWPGSSVESPYGRENTVVAAAVPQAWRLKQQVSGPPMKPPPLFPVALFALLKSKKKQVCVFDVVNWSICRELGQNYVAKRFPGSPAEINSSRGLVVRNTACH